jgi:hypothetical protein
MKQISTLSRKASVLAALGIWLLAALFAAGCNGESTGTAVQPLIAACVEHGAPIPDDVWVCGANWTVECDTHEGAHVDAIYTRLAAGDTCASAKLVVNKPEPYFLPNSYDVQVTRATSGMPSSTLCRSRLTVIDSEPPQVTTQTIKLWPPNHKLQHLTPRDCVTVLDACDPDVRVWFTSAISDEPENSEGDGNAEPDIVGLSCSGVSLRAERQGTMDGRVYTLGWHTEDHQGNAVDGTCKVIVPHDDGGDEVIDSGMDHGTELSPGACK